jgi:predicted transcriptional regulator
MNTATLNFPLTTDISQRLEALAQATVRSMSQLVSEAIDEYLAVQEWQVQAILEGMQAADQGDVVAFEQVKQDWEKRFENSSD